LDRTDRTPELAIMKLIILLAIVGVACAQQRAGAGQRSSGNPAEAQILRYESENPGDGTYSYLYETSDGTSAAQKGYLKPPPQGEEDPIQVAEGYFQFYSPEGEQYKVDYLADENGFQPQGAHLPTAPPIPPEILKSLEINYKNAADQVNRASASNQFTQRQPFRQQPQRRF